MSSFVRHIATYSKYAKTEKGAELYNYIAAFEHCVLEHATDLSLLVWTRELVKSLNKRFPKSAEWRVTDGSYGFSVVPLDKDGNAKVDDSVLIVTVVPVQHVYSRSFEVREWADKFFDGKGGEA